jgi:hypothetical protein
MQKQGKSFHINGKGCIFRRLLYKLWAHSDNCGGGGGLCRGINGRLFPYLLMGPFYIRRRNCRLFPASTREFIGIYICIYGHVQWDSPSGNSRMCNSCY